DDPLPGKPAYQVDDVDAAAQHHRVEILATAPAVDDLVDAAVIVVALDVKEPSELTRRDARFERAKAGRAAQDEIRGQAEFRMVGEGGADCRQLGLRLAERLLDEDML